MRRMIERRSTSLLMVATIGTVIWVNAGSLTPPDGPVAPTMKTLVEVEPRIAVDAANTPGDVDNTFIISAPGSYYLTGNLTGEPDKHGISIQANDVTLDLNGFALISGSGGVHGVDTPVELSNFCIRNGTVRGWSGGGVWAGAATTQAEKLRLVENAGGAGLTVGNGSIVKDCVATGNTTGFYCPDRTHVSNCIATVNTGNGFECTSYVTVVDCTASRNAGNGIVCAGDCTVSRCAATRNDGHGIDSGAGSTFADCTASFNVQSGIVMIDGGVVRDCTARRNQAYGIYAPYSVHVIGNTCEYNQWGIGVFTGARIERNFCSWNTVNGYEVTGTTSFIAGNTGHANGNNSSAANFNVVSGNAFMVENMTGGGVTTSSAWSNFYY